MVSKVAIVTGASQGIGRSTAVRIELLWFAAALLASLPVLNALTTQRPLWRSLADGDWVYAGFDLMTWALAALHAALAVCTARHRPRTKAAAQGRVNALATQEDA